MGVNYKLVCWHNYQAPVPIGAKWMAFDENGRVWWYTRKPRARADQPFLTWVAKGTIGHMFGVLWSVRPPEPGPWEEQLYWIGD